MRPDTRIQFQPPPTERPPYDGTVRVRLYVTSTSVFSSWDLMEKRLKSYMLQLKSDYSLTSLKQIELVSTSMLNIDKEIEYFAFLHGIPIYFMPYHEVTPERNSDIIGLLKSKPEHQKAPYHGVLYLFYCKSDTRLNDLYHKAIVEDIRVNYTEVLV